MHEHSFPITSLINEIKCTQGSGSVTAWKACIKFIDGFPPTLKYKYVSVGKLIRDEINKKTHYSKIIMENLQKYKKINLMLLS